MARWYIIHAYSGFENKVRDQILAEAERIGLSQLVEAVEVPTEQVTEVRRGKKIKAERKFFPGYVLAKLNMNDDVYHLVKNTPKVTGFLGAGNKPQPITEAEAAHALLTDPARREGAALYDAAARARGGPDEDWFDACAWMAESHLIHLRRDTFPRYAAWHRGGRVRGRARC